MFKIKKKSSLQLSFSFSCALVHLFIFFPPSYLCRLINFAPLQKMKHLGESGAPQSRVQNHLCSHVQTQQRAAQLLTPQSIRARLTRRKKRSHLTLLSHVILNAKPLSFIIIIIIMIILIMIFNQDSVFLWKERGRERFSFRSSPGWFTPTLDTKTRSSVLVVFITGTAYSLKSRRGKTKSCFLPLNL